MWLAQYIVVDGERADWVIPPQVFIKKATVNFVAKYFKLFVWNRVSPTKTENILT